MDYSPDKSDTLDILKKKLAYLYKQKTTYGLDTPFHIQHEIDQVTENIQSLESEISNKLICPECKIGFLSTRSSSQTINEFIVFRKTTNTIETICSLCSYNLIIERLVTRSPRMSDENTKAIIRYSTGITAIYIGINNLNGNLDNTSKKIINYIINHIRPSSVLSEITVDNNEDSSDLLHNINTHIDISNNIHEEIDFDFIDVLHMNLDN